LVDLFEYMMMHGLTNPKFIAQALKRSGQIIMPLYDLYHPCCILQPTSSSIIFPYQHSLRSTYCEAPRFVIFSIFLSVSPSYPKQFILKSPQRMLFPAVIKVIK
jgi:hypothetical protein